MRALPTLWLSAGTGALVWILSPVLAVIAFVAVWVVAYLVAAKAGRI